MARNSYAAPRSAGKKEPLPRGYWLRRILLVSLAAIVLSLALFVARQLWRDHQLLAFCDAAKPGISFADLVALEKQYSIDASYSVDAQFQSHADGAGPSSLEFRSQMYDPDFACVITREGQRVKFVQLLTLEGYKR